MLFFHHRHSTHLFSLLALVMIWVAGPAYAADAVTDIEDLSLEDLLNEQVSVASVRPTTTRDAPGIITLITRKDIESSGARDLVDILNLVPGFFFGHDVAGVVGVGFRGIWGHEGKILLLWDGQEMNELAYGTLPLGGHYPVEQIERIEIIRGPGSAAYGGNAELAVINVVTRIGNNFEGVDASARLGTTQDKRATRLGSLSFGSKVKDSDWYVGGSLFVGQGLRSDRYFTDFTGSVFDMEDASDLETIQVNLKLASKNLHTRFFFDDHNVYEQISYGTNRPNAIPIRFRTYSGDIEYRWEISDELSIIPYASFKRQEPWRSRIGGPADNDFYESANERTRAGLKATIDPMEELSIVLGNEFDLYTARYGPGVALAHPDGTNDISYKNYSLYTDATFKHQYFNLTGGLRYEYHSQYGSSFVPRGAITSTIERFHAKALVSQAFHAPQIENIRTNPLIDAEKTTVFELEAGYQITDNIYFVANAFDITIDKPIVYTVPPAPAQDAYYNFDKTGTRGFELELRMRNSWGRFLATYSHYTADGKNRVPLYAVGADDDILLGSARNKITASASVKLGGGVTFDPSFIFLSKRYGYITQDLLANPVLSKFDTSEILNLQIRAQDILVDGLTASFAVMNVLDENVSFIEPYDGGIAPLPGQSREFLIRLAYEWERPASAETLQEMPAEDSE